MRNNEHPLPPLFWHIMADDPHPLTLFSLFTRKTIRPISEKLISLLYRAVNNEPPPAILSQWRRSSESFQFVLSFHKENDQTDFFLLKVASYNSIRRDYNGAIRKGEQGGQFFVHDSPLLFFLMYPRPVRCIACSFSSHEIMLWMLLTCVRTSKQFLFSQTFAELALPLFVVASYVSSLAYITEAACRNISCKSAFNSINVAGGRVLCY